MSKRRQSPFFSLAQLEWWQVVGILIAVSTILLLWQQATGANNSKTSQLSPMPSPVMSRTYSQVLAAQTEVLEVPTTGVATVDDDPVLGSATAPVTMVALLDFECPFCRKFYLELLPQLDQKYIQTGQLKIVFRDVPLPFHEPAATREALAANCARQQGGDAAYLSFQKNIFTQTQSNGNGLSLEQLSSIARIQNLKSLRFQLCMDEPSMLAEIAHDLKDAEQSGLLGTPTFVVGPSNSTGQVTGALILGAQPLSTFEATIEGGIN
jgi:protein-disulfide isomerase